MPLSRTTTPAGPAGARRWDSVPERPEGDVIPRWGSVLERPDVDVTAAAARALRRCESYLVDGRCGYDVGVVERVVTDPGAVWPRSLVVVRGWRRRPVRVPADQVVEIRPAERRLVLACPTGHEATCPHAAARR
jgi:hypothetical protein